MKTLLFSSLLLLTFNINAQNVYYLISNVNGGEDPWYTWGPEFTNTDHMTTVFGEEGIGWTKAFYETLVPATVFSPTTCSIFMEGGENTAIELELFLNANLPLIESWVFNGGHLFINSAPNESNGGSGMVLGFGGVSLYYVPGPSYIDSALALNPLHPIFNGPALPVGLNWNGMYFAHGNIVGPGLTPLIVNIEDSSKIALAELNWGSGKALFGGMSLAKFHFPLPNSENLRINIIAYNACVVCTPEIPTGLFADNITMTKARLHWDAVPEVDKYSVSVYTSDGALFLKKSTALNYLNVKLLTPGTDYVFKVRSVCVDEGTQSPPSAPSYFTTLTRLGSFDADISIYPNPNNGVFSINADVIDNGNYQLSLINTTGQSAFTKEIVINNGEYNELFSLPSIPAGLYLLILSNSENLVQYSIVIN